jgi:hypothetical protein
MEAVDGNAIAGELYEFFGREMTTARGACTHCGARAQIGELRVFSRAPGDVVRCRGCGSVVMVAVEVRGRTNVNMDGFRLDEP